MLSPRRGWSVRLFEAGCVQLSKQTTVDQPRTFNREAVTAYSRGCKPTENDQIFTKVAKRRQEHLVFS